MLEDLIRMNVRGYSEMAMDRRLVLKAQHTLGCSAKKKKIILFRLLYRILFGSDTTIHHQSESSNRGLPIYCSGV